jgi:hypothetical protein
VGVERVGDSLNSVSSCEPSVHPFSALVRFTSAPHPAFPLGLLDGMPNEEITGPGFGFAFLAFLFSRLLFCSRFAITDHHSG